MRSVLIAFALAALAACEHRPPGAAAPSPSTDGEGRLLLDGLGEFGPQIREAMGTRAERAARAPYSPPGWPVKLGEAIPSFQADDDSWYELMEEFPWVCGIDAPFWVGDMVFGATWSDAPSATGVEYSEPWRTSDGEVAEWLKWTAYTGHYRAYVSDDPRPSCLSKLPAYVRGDHTVFAVPAERRGEFIGMGGDWGDPFHEPGTLEELWLAGYVGQGR